MCLHVVPAGVLACVNAVVPVFLQHCSTVALVVIFKDKKGGWWRSLGDSRTRAHDWCVGRNADGWRGWGSGGWQQLIASKHSSSGGGY